MRQSMITCGQFATAVVLVLVSVPAYAEPSTAGEDESIVEASPSGLNLPGIGGYSLSADVRTLYDSNLLRLGDGLSPRPGQVKADFRISPSVTGEVGIPFGRQNVFLTGLVGRDYFLRNPQLNRNRFRVGGGVNLLIGNRCSVNGNMSFNSRQVLVSDIAELVPSVRHTTLYGASANCQSAVGFGFGGNFQRSEIRNKDSSRSEFDLNSQGFGINASYGLGTIGRFQLSGNTNKVSYINRTIILPDGSLDTDSVKLISGRFGFNRQLGTRMALTAGISYYETRPDPVTVLQAVGITQPPLPPAIIIAPVDRTKLSGFGYDLTIQYTPSPRLSATLAARRSAGANANLGAQSSVSTSVLGNIDYNLGTSMSIGAGASYSKRTYQNSVITEPDRFRLRLGDDISRVYANVRYTARRLFSIRGEVAYQKRRSDPAEFGFSGLSATLALNVNYGRES